MATGPGARRAKKQEAKPGGLSPELVLAAISAEASHERAIHREREYLQQRDIEAAEIKRLDKMAAQQKAAHDANVGAVEVGGKLVRAK